MAAHGPRTVAAIVVAAGSGARLGADVPKAFVDVAGKTLLEHAAGPFLAHPHVDVVVVVAPAEHLDLARTLIGLDVVAGGGTRQASVAAGLAVLDPQIQFVLVHDAARPFVPGAVIDGVLAALRDGAQAVVPVLGIHDTVRRVAADGTLADTVDRSTLVAVQTPQGFRRAVLVEAHEHGMGLAATDDAGLVEAHGGRVTAVPGAEDAFKVTTPADLERAVSIARLRSAAQPTMPGGTP
jgi:2-C-methyl-D-erythritol 4-phosphate cytidylyltransferase